MKNYLLLFVISFFSFFAPASAEEESSPSPSAVVDKPASKVSEQVLVIQELLSQKFDYFGEKLNRRIQKIEKGESFSQLKSIKRSLIENQSSFSSKRKKSEGEQKENRVTVNIFVEKEYEAKEEDDKFKRALLAAAYFPEELEQEKSLSLIDFVSSNFIHRQLAFALSYGHPLAEKYLVDIASIYDVPLESIYEQPITEAEITEKYNKYSFQFELKDIEDEAEVDKEDIGDDDINKKVTFSPSSQEALTYFQDIFGESLRKKKR